MSDEDGGVRRQTGKFPFGTGEKIVQDQAKPGVADRCGVRRTNAPAVPVFSCTIGCHVRVFYCAVPVVCYAMCASPCSPGPSRDAHHVVISRGRVWPVVF